MFEICKQCRWVEECVGAATQTKWQTRQMSHGGEREPETELTFFWSSSPTYYSQFLKILLKLQFPLLMHESILWIKVTHCQNPPNPHDDHFSFISQLLPTAPTGFWAPTTPVCPLCIPAPTSSACSTSTTPGSSAARASCPQKQCATPKSCWSTRESTCSGWRPRIRRAARMTKVSQDRLQNQRSLKFSVFVFLDMFQ